MFSALVITRVLVEVILRREAMARRVGLLGLEVGGRLRQWLAERGPDLLSRARVWFAISAVLPRLRRAS
jgi:SecD/SecF fusion protein